MSKKDRLHQCFPNLFSTAAHFPGTAHQTAHCIYGTYMYFIYKTYIFFSLIIQKYVKFVFAKLNRSFLQAALSLHLFYIQDLHIITYFSPSLLQKSIKFVFAKLNPSFLQAALSISCNFFAICRSKKSSW